MIGFDRSALVASPDSSGFANQNVNRVVVRFITKVFWSILSKSIDGTKALLVSSPAPRDRTPVLAAQLQRGQRGCQDVPVVRMRFDVRESGHALGGVRSTGDRGIVHRAPMASKSCC